MSGSSHHVPFYKPTPIEHLDDPKEEPISSSSSIEDFPTLKYKPTPISELEMYSPINPSIYSPHISYTNSEAPSYSPVIKRSTSNLTRNDFCLPSPAYPPITDESFLKRKFPKPAIPVKRMKKSSSKMDNVKVNNDAIKSEEKRKKIISLYLDLYADDDEPIDDKKMKSSKITPATKTLSSGKKNNLPSSFVKPTSFVQPMPVSQSEALIDKISVSKDVPIARPIAPLRRSTKIPMPIRTRYLDQFIAACLRVAPSQSQAYTLALNEEQECHDKAGNRLVYLNMVIASLKMLKSRPIFTPPPPSLSPKSPSLNPSTSKVIPKPAERPTVDLDELVKGPKLYDELKPFLMSDNDLVVNGYPRLDTSDKAPRGRVCIPIPANKKAAIDACGPNQRFCCRCGNMYTVNTFGEAVNKQECTYHWGKPIRCRVPGFGIDLRYTCCQAETGQQGCHVSYGGHVFDTNKWCDLDGYLSTLPALPQSDPDAAAKVYAVDCEMVYTTGGCELARVSVIDSRMNVVVDKIVRPENPIIDANTRFSGLNKEEIEAAETRITDVQIELLHLWDEDTVLIGHSLESDLTALKFVHPKVVDTALVFPHRMGLPFKRALRTIVGEYLHQVIQQNETGHDSKEDAVACMRLMQLKVKEALQKRLRKSSAAVSSSLASP